MLLVDYGLPRREFYTPSAARAHCAAISVTDSTTIHSSTSGLQDITAWVDFTAVAEAADGAGLDVVGYTTQADFLIGAGMESLLATEMQLAGDDLKRRRRSRRSAPAAVARRNGRDIQGHRLGRGYESPLAGFSTQWLPI